MKLYTLKYCEDLISKYINIHKGEAETIKEGSLGLGTILLHGAEGKKSVVIQEVFLNAWSSGHTIKMYNKLPKKYLIHS